jgi:cyclophilin family peptidyl-prolyl cis-trans isomerase
MNDEATALVRCGTTQGEIVLELYRHWSPHGYDRAVQLLEAGFFDNSHFFRTVPGFLVQFGITYAGEDVAKLGRKPIPDDPQLDPKIPFTEGTISYAGM